MLSLLLCSIVLYQFIQNIEPNQTDIVFPYYFGFEIDGNYSIFITNGGNDSFILSIQPVDYLKYLKEDELHLACTDYNYSQTINNNNHVIHLQNGKYNISGSINQKYIYKTLIKFCTNHHHGFKIEGIYMNPNSSFGYDTAKVLKLFLVLIHIRTNIFIIWLINWMNYFSMKNILHLAFTFTSFIFLISKIIDYFDYKTRYQSNQISLISIIRPYSDILREIIVLNTFFLINCCVCIEKNWRKTIYFKILFLWIFYLIFYNLLYKAFKNWVFYLVGFLVHIMVNDIIMIISGVGDDDDMIFVLNQLKSFFYILLMIFEKYDMRTEIDGYFVYDIFVVIMQSVNAYFFRMRNNTKNDYTKLFHLTNNDDYHQLNPTDNKI